MKLVVIGNAQTGLEFVGPFEGDGEANAYVTTWKDTHKKSTPIGVVPLHAPDHINAGKQLPER